jgi:hypothetical protein
MDTQKRMLKLGIDIALAVLLVGTYMTGHAEPHVHALVALLFVVQLVAHGVVSHRKIVQTTRHVTCKAMSKEARIDCCLGLAMVVFLAIVLVSGGSLMHARMAEGLSLDDTVGTPAFFRTRLRCRALPSLRTGARVDQSRASGEAAASHGREGLVRSRGSLLKPPRTEKVVLP